MEERAASHAVREQHVMTLFGVMDVDGMTGLVRAAGAARQIDPAVLARIKRAFDYCKLSFSRTLNQPRRQRRATLSVTRVQ